MSIDSGLMQFHELWRARSPESVHKPHRVVVVMVMMMMMMSVYTEPASSCLDRFETFDYGELQSVGRHGEARPTVLEGCSVYS